MENRKRVGVAMAAAAATLFVSSVVRTAAAEEGKVKCEGVNSCKGASACKSATNACRGRNECAGKGYLALTKDECQAAKSQSGNAADERSRP